LRTAFDVRKKRQKIEKLEETAENPDFWKDQKKAVETNQEMSVLKEEIFEVDKLNKDIIDLRELEKIVDDEKDLEKEIEKFEKKLEKLETKAFLSGRYDRGNAILSIYSGAGGQDAQDWAAMLLRMYQRYGDLKGFKVNILHQSFGEGGGPEGRIGIKSATIEIKGKYAYGFLKKETGVHRLVRLSPFSAKSLRHTSFVLAEVLPELSKAEDSEIELNPDELRVDTFRASGPGGQYVNKRESAIRITHLPTNVVVSCQSERLQGLNRDKALKVLKAKLFQLKKEQSKKELKEIKGNNISASWGNQIRSYVFHPYKLVKDLRTDVETSQVEDVLDGNLEEFIEAEIKLKND